MLTALRISGFAIVDRLEVRFGPGLHVLTGETGAGKSILLQALAIVLGGRMSADVLREGAEEAVVEALFELPRAHPAWARLDAAGLAPPGEGDPAELLVRRSVTRAGRGRAFVNGGLCTAHVLGAALRGLVDLSGQHEHVSLLDEATHLALLDAFAGADAGPYRAAHAALAALLRERAALAEGEAERARRQDWLAFALHELEAARLEPGEEEALLRERQVLASAERLRVAARGAEGLAYADDGSASERIAAAARALHDAAAIDARLGEPLALLRAAAAEVDEAGRQLARYAESVGGDPERLAAVEERLELLRALARKHGGSVDAAIGRREALRAELAAVAGGGERREAVERELAAAGPRALALARALGAIRREGAARLAASVEAELGRLAMGRCKVEVELPAAAGAASWEGVALGPDGAEGARLLLAPNPGEPPRPLARIASGGELSRLLLAVKRALARVDPVPTYVFDEVDAGVGGAVAEAVGRALAAVASGRQVLCVTHLPQVAAFADRHHRVEKRVVAGRTATVVTPLEDDGARRAEIARMLAGATVTSSALDHAGALLGAARAGRRAVPAAWAARPARSTRGRRGRARVAR
jgi:DNA repair protein RecN (Recombination protein N)